MMSPLVEMIPTAGTTQSRGRHGNATASRPSGTPALSSWGSEKLKCGKSSVPLCRSRVANIKRPTMCLAKSGIAASHRHRCRGRRLVGCRARHNDMSASAQARIPIVCSFACITKKTPVVAWFAHSLASARPQLELILCWNGHGCSGRGGEVENVAGRYIIFVLLVVRGCAGACTRWALLFFDLAKTCDARRHSPSARIISALAKSAACGGGTRSGCGRQARSCHAQQNVGGYSRLSGAAAPLNLGVSPERQK